MSPKKFRFLTREERIQFYLGEDLIQGRFDSNDSQFTNVTEMVQSYPTVEKTLPKFYYEPFRKLLIKTNNQDKKFKIAGGDIQIETDPLTFVKNRKGGNETSSVILFSLNNDRHWQHFYNRPLDLRYGKKLNTCFWRGTTTGSLFRDDLLLSVDEYEKHLRPGNRIQLVTQYFQKSPKIDVAFSFLHRPYLIPKYGKYVKGYVSISFFLKHKYLISVEGNDKDSGLQWKLNSNSLVMMPKPKFVTWLMETRLVPDYHYVLLQDDFSNLEEKINYYEKNRGEAQKIIKQANEYMAQFQDRKYEEALEEEVVNRYFQITKQK